MKDRILVDTSIWIEFLRSGSRSGDRLESLLKEYAVWTCGMVIFELLQGIKSGGEKNKILDVLAGLPYVEMTPKLWQSAAELSGALKKNGVQLPLSDILIAAIAIGNDLSIYTLDKHFEQIPNLKLYKE